VTTAARLAAAALLVAAATAACTDTPGRAPATNPVCADARAATLDSTAALIVERDRAVAARERGDTAARDAAIAAVRRIFTDWSAMLRAQADRAADPRLKTTLQEYGGAVDAVASRLEPDGDLEILYSFDGSELDVAASRFSEVCP
jgi:hypothetical protein